MAPAAKQHDKSVAETSSTMRNTPMTSYSKSRFAAFMDSDDHDDNGGGVMLRDFEDDSHTSGYASTPMGTNSSTSSGNARDTDSHKKSSTSSFGKPATLGRRNTIAPIGTGRYSEQAKNGNGGASLNPSVDSWVCVGRAGIKLFFGRFQ
jgi:hypothetical protein